MNCCSSTWHRFHGFQVPCFFLEIALTILMSFFVCSKNTVKSFGKRPLNIPREKTEGLLASTSGIIFSQMFSEMLNNKSLQNPGQLN